MRSSKAEREECLKRKPGFLMPTNPNTAYPRKVFLGNNFNTANKQVCNLGPSTSKAVSTAVKDFSYLPAVNYERSFRPFEDNRVNAVRKSQKPSNFDARDYQVVTCSITKIGEIYATSSSFKLFEIFGKVNSPVVSHPTFEAVEFVLRDESDAISCIYYIYNVKVKVVRGGHYRCVGRVYCQDKTKFHCISIRPSTDVERKYMKALITF